MGKRGRGENNGESLHTPRTGNEALCGPPVINRAAPKHHAWLKKYLATSA
jgi:hypothetical protein